MITFEEIDQQIVEATGIAPDPSTFRVIRVARVLYLGLGLTDDWDELRAMDPAYLRAYSTDDYVGTLIVAQAVRMHGAGTLE